MLGQPRPAAAASTGSPTHSFGYLTIPTLALTAFLLLIGFLVLPRPKSPRHRLPFPPHAERYEGEQQRQAGRGDGAAARALQGRSAEPRARQASPRALAIGGGVVLIVVIAIVLGVVLSGRSGRRLGSKSSRRATLQACRRPGAQVGRRDGRSMPTANNLFKGIPQNGLTSSAIRRRRSRWRCSSTSSARSARTTRSTHLPADRQQVHPDGEGAAAPQTLGLPRPTVLHRAIRRDRRCPAEQEFRVRQGPLRQPGAGRRAAGCRAARWRTIAASVDGLDLAQWKDNVNSSATQATASAVDNLAERKKVHGTPTIFTGRTGGTLSNVQTPGGGTTPRATRQRCRTPNERSTSYSLRRRVDRLLKSRKERALPA